MIEQLSIDSFLQKLKQKIPPRFQRVINRARFQLRKNLLKSMAINAIVSAILMLSIFLGVWAINDDYARNTPLQLQLTREAGTLITDDSGFTNNLLLELYTLDLKYKKIYKDAEPVSLEVQKRLLANITPDLKDAGKRLQESADILFAIEGKAMKFADRAIQIPDKAKAQTEVQKGLALMNSAIYLKNKQIFKNAALELIGNVRKTTDAKVQERGERLKGLMLLAAGNFFFLSLLWLVQWSVTNDTILDNKLNKIYITDADNQIRANNAYLLDALAKERVGIMAAYEQEIGAIVATIEKYTAGKLARTEDRDLKIHELGLIVYELNHFVDKLNSILWAIDLSIFEIDKQHSEQLKLISNARTSASGLLQHLRELTTLDEKVSDCFMQIDRVKDNRAIAPLAALIPTARPTIEAARSSAIQLNQSSEAIATQIAQIKSLAIDNQQVLLAAGDESKEAEIRAALANLISERESSEAALELQSIANRLLKFATQNNGSIELLKGSQEQVDNAVDKITHELSNFTELTADLIDRVDRTYQLVDAIVDLIADCKIHNQQVLTATTNLGTLTHLQPLILSSQARAKTIVMLIGKMEAGFTLQKNNQIQLGSLIGCFKSDRFPQKM